MKKYIWPVFVLMGLLACLGLAGCGPEKKPSSASSAVFAQVTDDAGRTVTIKEKPKRIVVLSTSLLISRNIYVRGFRHNDEHVSPEHMKNVARYLILILTAIALYLSIFHANLLVNLLLTGYAGVTQFFPIIVLGLFWKKASKLGAVCGLIVGEFLVFSLILSKMDPVALGSVHINAGFFALCINTIVFVIVSMITSSGKTKMI